MILTLYVVLMVLALILITIGYAFDSVILKIVGYGCIFMFNVPAIIDGIQYHSGDLVENSGDDKIITMQYSVYENRTMFILFSVIGMLGATLLSWDEYKFRRDVYEPY
jgi:hypothetical protein